MPVLADPKVDGTYFMAGEYVWRTKDSGGAKDFLEANCLEGSIPYPAPDCGDFERVGPMLSPDGPLGSDYIVALGRASSDTSTMWVGLRKGELFVSKNIDAAAGSVTYNDISAPTQPGRFVSGISVDPKDPNHAWISYSGYSAYTPTQPGHVFEAHYNPATGKATFVNRSYDLGDQPVTGIALDGLTGDVYASTDFGVARLASGATAWADAASGLPTAAVYGVAMQGGARVLYGATHGRGTYQLALDPVAAITGPSSAFVGFASSYASAGSAAFGTTAYLWTLPSGKTATTSSVSWTPTKTGPQTIRLKVTDSLGHSVTTSKTVTAAIKKPGTPGVPRVFPNTTTARVTITPAPAGSGGAPTRYVVTASPGGRTCTALVPATNCLVTGLVPGRSYTYRATAYNAAGASNPSAATKPIRQLVRQVPVANLNLPASLRNPGTTLLIHQPVRTNAKQTATVRVNGVAVAGIAPRGDVSPFRVVRASNGNVFAVVSGAAALRVTVTVSAPAVPGFTPYSFTKVYTTTKVA